MTQHRHNFTVGEVRGQGINNNNPIAAPAAVEYAP